MLKPEYTKKFKKDLELAKKRNCNINKLKEVIRKLLSEEVPLLQNFRDHILSGKLEGFRECHIEPDWLLVYYYKPEDVIVFYRTGTHSDLFR